MKAVYILAGIIAVLLGGYLAFIIIEGVRKRIKIVNDKKKGINQ